MKQLRGGARKDFWKQIKQPAVGLVFVLPDVEDPVNIGASDA